MEIKWVGSGVCVCVCVWESEPVKLGSYKVFLPVYLVLNTSLCSLYLPLSISPPLSLSVSIPLPPFRVHPGIKQPKTTPTSLIRMASITPVANGDAQRVGGMLIVL